MTKLLIGHDFNEELRFRHGAGSYAQRLLWFAEHGDVVVLPVAPEPAFLEYITGLTNVRASTLRIVIPPRGDGQLTREVLRDPAFTAELREAIGGREIERVYALWPDARIAELTKSLGLEHALPGLGFLSQGGDAVVNSKAMFRTIAAGIGAPIAEGAVCLTKESAADAMRKIMLAGHPVMLKHSFYSGGWGNDIVSFTADFSPKGGVRMAVLADDLEIPLYLDERWGHLTDSGRHALVVERYHPNSEAAFAEFLIDDDGVHFGGQGSLLSLPDVASVLPAPNVTPDNMKLIIDDARRICEALHALGYRGVLCPDAIVTPDGEVLFTEYNGRSTGSTHMYGIIGKKVIGPGFGVDRTIVDRQPVREWSVGSFQEAADRLRATDLAWDPETRRGVMLTQPYNAVTRSVPYVVVDESLEAAVKTETLLKELFESAPERG